MLKISLNEVDVPASKAHEIVLKMEALPINWSVMWPMFGPADFSKSSLRDNKSVLTTSLYPGILSRIKPHAAAQPFVNPLTALVWLLMCSLGKLAPARVGELYKRVADEINSF